ncbi:hypothetical protein GDO81_030204 [Engystomops pustulosus]|uniref:AEBP2-like C-terminal SH3 domain-containing protein n=1 Tax=Engystomops pustulosus TaxID=76066 RepID=A0AAV6YJC6_ENGPU|nr:hypothetical protein GDO81_030204 [Engystomops pustulosus]
MPLSVVCMWAELVLWQYPCRSLWYMWEEPVLKVFPCRSRCYVGGASRPHDFFDAQTLEAIRHRAICFNLSAQIDSLGNGHSVVFHSTVIAKRKEESGKVKLLLHWTPEDM